jgi:hypothetical protein
MGRGGGMGRGGDGTVTYALDGKEATIEQPVMGGNTVPVTLKATVDGGKVVFSRTLAGPMGTVGTKETWELSADGKTLTVTTERTSPRGTDTTTRVFTKS